VNQDHSHDATRTAFRVPLQKVDEVALGGKNNLGGWQTWVGWGGGEKNTRGSERNRRAKVCVGRVAGNYCKPGIEPQERVKDRGEETGARVPGSSEPVGSAPEKESLGGARNPTDARLQNCRGRGGEEENRFSEKERQYSRPREIGEMSLGTERPMSFRKTRSPKSLKEGRGEGDCICPLIQNGLQC